MSKHPLQLTFGLVCSFLGHSIHLLRRCMGLELRQTIAIDDAWLVSIDTGVRCVRLHP